MGRQQMGRIAVSNFLRKLVQLAALFILFRLFDFDAQASLLVAIGTFIGSELITFLYLFYLFMIQFQHIKSMPFSNLNRKTVRKNLMAVSIPTTSMRLFSAFTGAIQPFLIKAALEHSGLTETLATEHFGMLMGIAASIGFFPAFIAHSLLIVLIPGVSKTHAENNYQNLQKMLQQVMKLTLVYGTAAVAVFYFFAPQLTGLFFKSDTSAIYLQLLWPYFLFHYFIIPLQGFLLGLDLIKEAFYHVIWSHIVSFAIIFWLGSMPEWRMDGVIIGLNTGAVLLCLMHYLTVCKKIGLSFFMRGIVPKTLER